MNDWKIEAYYQTTDKWFSITGFDFMSKQYSAGAWAMLKSFYNHKRIYRLKKGDVVVEEMGKQEVKV